MISSLYIKNIALIPELSIELGEGLNILSGETGAGKSIIIDSLNFVLGDRADRSLIRYGEKTACVKVVFSNFDDNINNFLESFGIEIDDIIIIERMMTNSRSECRINGQIVNLSTLRKIVVMLIDVHSQNEHQSLMKVQNHIKILDEYANGISSIKEEFQQKYENYKFTKQRIESFLDLDERERKIDILAYQID